ncbi:hypothetical protein C483_09756 [Natrialba hulunbeirensis JCM 10989]|uniref:Uncharacterized protein n=1 Tax=Natrialba hulunbeirensis JCM 10989 TaxID=1227493 RepID=L9ZXT1_9EURY|nr:hypothetical protein C483_09756 [Natrialba hulunbeirensis JCM 10989]
MRGVLHGALFTVGLLTALGLVVVNGVGTLSVVLAVFSVAVLAVALRRNEHDRDQPTSESSGESGTAGQKEDTMPSPGEGNL